jgi:agmatine/peptidylarginine deiminase
MVLVREALARRALAPPPLGDLPGSTMLAVASVPGKIPEEWQQAYPLWMAWPHAAGAVCAVEMTAAQLRARLAEMTAR